MKPTPKTVSAETAAEVLQTLKNLVGLAVLGGGRLHLYKSAIAEAKEVIATAERAA